MKPLPYPLRAVPALFAALLLALLAACSSSNTPEATVETLLFAAAKGDVEKTAEQFSMAGVPDADLMQAKGKVQIMVGEMQKAAQAHGGLKSVEIVKSETSSDGKSAKVQAKLKYGDGKDGNERFTLVQDGGRWKVSFK